MYVPPASRESRIEVLQTAVAALRFGTLVTLSGGELRATHLPIAIDTTRGPRGTLVGHIARNNPQWRDLDASVAGIATFMVPTST